MKEAARAAADESATRGVYPPGAPPTSSSTVTIEDHNVEHTTTNLHISADEAAQDSAQASAHYCGSAATTTASATRGARPAPLLMEKARAAPSAAASPARRGRGRAPGAYHLIPGAAACRRRPTSSAATHRHPAGS